MLLQPHQSTQKGSDSHGEQKKSLSWEQKREQMPPSFLFMTTVQFPDSFTLTLYLETRHHTCHGYHAWSQLCSLCPLESSRCLHVSLTTVLFSEPSQSLRSECTGMQTSPSESLLTASLISSGDKEALARCQGGPNTQGTFPAWR